MSVAKGRANHVHHRGESSRVNIPRNLSKKRNAAMASNIEVIKGLYESFAKGDIGAVLGALDEKIDWQEPESLPFDYQIGPQAVAENIFSRVMVLVPNFSATPSEIHAAGDVVFGIGTYRGTAAATGTDFQAAFVHVWRLRNGKITGFRTFTDTHVWIQALGEVSSPAAV
jgi:ketosteroid isomerase-like protein